MTLTAKLADGGKPVTGAQVTVAVVRPEESIGNWLAAHEVTSDELEQIAARQGDETLFDVQRKALYLTDVRGVAPPLQLAPIKLKLRDDGARGDEKAGDGLYTGRFTGTRKTGTYSFRFRATGTTATGEPFVREARSEKPVAVFVSARDLEFEVVRLAPGDDRSFQLRPNLSLVGLLGYSRFEASLWEPTPGRPDLLPISPARISLRTGSSASLRSTPRGTRKRSSSIG